jgi:HNH endonuclease
MAYNVPMTEPLDFHQRYRIEDRGYETPCWIWQGAKWRNGYGVIHVLGTSKANGTSRNEGAHRHAYNLRYGSIPAGKRVLHRCDQPDCVNWDHLFCGTQKQNIQDAVRKGRMTGHPGLSRNSGTANAGAKISLDDVVRIRELCARGYTMTEVAKHFPISRTQVGRIHRGQRWVAT